MGKQNLYIMPINEYAEREKLSTKTVRRQIYKGELVATKVKIGAGHNKNRDQYQIHFSGLSSQELRDEYLKDHGLLKTDEKNPNNNELSHLKPWQREALTRKEGIVKEYLEASENVPAGKITNFQTQFSEMYGINPRTLRRYVDKFQEGGRHALVPAWNPGNYEKLIT
jgi:hypothetical protein